MHEILEFLRVPVVVTVLANLVGVGTGLALELRSSRALWGSVSAVCFAALSTAALAPEAVLAPSGICLGYAVTAMMRNRTRRQLKTADSTEN
ncbi:predicted membrane protein [Microbacterium testaceum StLB037]|uniref:Predicted membrane protein n=1 Tax=Microbacterium testaceum (strain StLB037) TaxID=979556 RepID=E8N960_MICTS|nr:predicted membrane protein [Microbacterium testaceum StLB037]